MKDVVKNIIDNKFAEAKSALKQEVSERVAKKIEDKQKEYGFVKEGKKMKKEEIDDEKDKDKEEIEEQEEEDDEKEEMEEKKDKK